MITFKRADRNTWNKKIKKVNGAKMILVAIQHSRRTSRRGKTKYIYNLQNTEKIYYNRSEGGVLFMPIAFSISDMQKYYETFAKQPLTQQEKAWLNLYDYSLVVQN